ncbi:MAG: hypothetical protein V4643_01985 [Bacteroidota bacterium]
MPISSKINKTGLVIYTLFLVELLVFFMFKKQLDFIVAPIVFTVCGLAIAYYPLVKEPLGDAGNRAPQKPNKYIVYLALAIVSLSFCLWAHFIFINNPIDIKKSDIIPYINEVYVKRFINNEWVYAKAPGLGYGNWTPNYLPFHWFPFVLAKVLQIDFRWIPFVAYLLSVFVYAKQLLKQAHSAINITGKLLLPFVILFFICFKQTSELAHTVELLIASYYFLLSIFINNNSLLGRGFSLTATLLSRYVVIFYLPVALLIEWLSNRKQAILQVVFVLVAVSICYVIPFLSRDWSIFTEGAKSYDIATLGEWDGQDWQPKTDNPFQLFQGLGFASWVYLLSNAPLPARVDLHKHIMFVAIIISIVCLAYIVLKKHKTVKPQFLHLLALKTLLTIVFAFALVPYNYLFWSSIVISITIVSNYKLVDEN